MASTNTGGRRCQTRTGKRCGKNVFRIGRPAGIRHRTWVSDPPGGLLGAPAVNVAGHAGVAAGVDRVCRADAGAAGKQPAQRTRVGIEPAGIDGVAARAAGVGRAPCDGTAYVFANRRRTRLKLVCWDGTGVWMCFRRLHRGQFVWPQPDDACWRMSAEQWRWLVAGVDWQRLSAPAPTRWRLCRHLFARQQADLARRDALLAENDFKITALTHELAYYRRIRFGKASEALVGEQRLLFEETVDTDLAAIEEELETAASRDQLRPFQGHVTMVGNPPSK
uniref:Transposase TnpC homeodomain domain-containing protein n=1 Tax=Tanacetum cinerariifolium TaxID=118510 RepID=A0A699GFD9_TANCI|nr:hypothetical protein [Tanacetum cinerariifolium]